MGTFNLKPTILVTNENQAPTAITVTQKLDGYTVKWDPLGPLYAVEIWQATVNNRNNAVKVATVKDNYYDSPPLTVGANYYIWVRQVDALGNVGTWNPNSSSGVTISVQGVQTASIANQAVTIANTAYVADVKNFLSTESLLSLQIFIPQAASGCRVIVSMSGLFTPSFTRTGTVSTGYTYNTTPIAVSLQRGGITPTQLYYCNQIGAAASTDVPGNPVPFSATIVDTPGWGYPTYTFRAETPGRVQYRSLVVMAAMK